MLAGTGTVGAAPGDVVTGVSTLVAGVEGVGSATDDGTDDSRPSLVDAQPAAARDTTTANRRTSISSIIVDMGKDFAKAPEVPGRGLRDSASIVASDENRCMHELVIRGGTVVDGTGAAPRVADVAIDDGVITAVGEVADAGATEIDASGALVTPGWVDVHTHYDGQVSWDPELAPSSHHGVTTVIMGNCGVGFAPVKPGSEGFLIELMEGVEDIPGTALHEGIDWTWETYGEYLDALEAMPRTIDVGGQLPHAAVRAYVLGDRAHEYDVTPEEIAEMAQITRDALDAGAFGFSTSRTFLHTSKHGLVPGTNSTPDEVIAIAEAVRDSGHGLFQYVSDDLGQGGDEDWLDSLKEMGCPTTYTLAQTPRMPEAYRTALTAAAETTAAKAPLIPQVAIRPTGMLFGLQSSFHPFIAHPSFRAHKGDSLEEKVALLRDSAFVERLLAEEPLTKDSFVTYMATAWHQIYRLGDPVDYEPTAESSAAGIARARRSPPRGGRDRVAAGERRDELHVLAARQLPRQRPRGDPRDARAPGDDPRGRRRRRPLRADLRRQLPHLHAHPLDP